MMLTVVIFQLRYVHILKLRESRVIVLDIMFPGMDGFAVGSKIRETSIPIF
jgi:CheY-like chemotaxis protein